MIYYFYSEKKGLKGVLNQRLIKRELKMSKKRAVEYAVSKMGLDRENPTGFIYIAKPELQKENPDGGYKVLPPVQIIGCIPVREIFENQ